MIVVDTGVLYAAADTDDDDHPACAAVLAEHRRDELIVPPPVIVETAWLIQNRLGPVAEASFLRATTAELTRVDLTDADWARCAELIDQYADLDLGLVDAAVVAVAERLGITTIATLDHRDLLVVRPNHVAAFELIP